MKVRLLFNYDEDQMEDQVDEDKVENQADENQVENQTDEDQVDEAHADKDWAVKEFLDEKGFEWDGLLMSSPSHSHKPS